MLITRRSLLTGNEHTRDVAVTHKQLADWQGGMLIQNAMPTLSADDREFLISGITPEEWSTAFGENDE